MSRRLTHADGTAIINAVYKEATGQTTAAITAENLSSFVSVGETILNTGMENTLNSLSLVLGRTWMAVRPYTAKLKIINALNTSTYSHRMRKISFYASGAENSGDWNTNLYTNLYNGYDNGTNPNASGVDRSTKSMWVQKKKIPLEMNFGGSTVWEHEITWYENQIQQAFRGMDEWLDFLEGIMTENSNDIESEKEAFNRITLLNYIAGLYDMSANMPGTVINVAAEFNTAYGTSYTVQQLLNSHLPELLAFFVSLYKTASRKLTNRSMMYHWSPSRTVDGTTYTALLRQTPVNKQRAIMYEPFFDKAEATVMPEIFNPNGLKIGAYEGVDFWQNEAFGPAISVTPAIPDVSDPAEQTTGDAVQLSYVLGLLYDEDAIMTDFQYEAANVTPLEARKRFRNEWFTFSKNAINDFTEKAVLFILEDVEPEAGEGGE